MVEWNRNISEICELDGNKIVSKVHLKPIFLRRELFFYDLFRDNSLVRTPKIYAVDKLNLQTYFIETEDKDVFKMAEEWARVHSHFMKNPIKDNRLLIPHDINEVTSYVLKNLEIFGGLSLIVENRLFSAKMNLGLTTLLHGDLQRKNMVTFQGENYYFDFELGGLGHPGRDVASMIISNPDKKEELITIYREHIDFNYSSLEEDINNWLLARAAQLYIIFDKRQGTSEQKNIIKGKLSKIIQSFSY